MKNKRGFTLLELLAVIVILAIIALIATPIILNMIENARKGAAKDSAYGYIEAVENYQAYEMLKGNEGLKEGIYNITEETLIGDTKYKKLTELIKIKGNNPTFGNIGITKNGTVGTANMCINDYAITYSNNKAEVIPGGCDDLGITLTYNISSEEWETAKTLEILYPKGTYEYYYKLESGKATVGEKDLVVGKEIQAETNSVTIELLENSKVTAWMMKSGKTISTRTYEETKIDNVEIGTVEVATTTSYPTLTQYGVELKTTLTLEYQEQEGTSPYYSVDNGVTWTKYTGSTELSGISVQAKLVRDESKREGEITTSTVATASDALGGDAYDGDDTTYHNLAHGSIAKINVSKEMWNKEFNLSFSTYPTHAQYIRFYNSNNDKLSETTFEEFTSPQTITIPENTTVIAFESYNANSSNYKIDIYEITVNDAPKYEVESIYPVLTSNGIEKGYTNVKPEYFISSIEKYYRIDGGDWLEYTGGSIKVPIGKKIDLQSRNKKESIMTSYTSTISDMLQETAYDGDDTTYHNLAHGSIAKINVSKEMWNKEFKLSFSTYPAYVQYIRFYDSNNETKGETTFEEFTSPQTITIPENTTVIVFESYNANSSNYKIDIYELKVK